MRKLIRKSGNFMVTDISSVKGVVFVKSHENLFFQTLLTKSQKGPIEVVGNSLFNERYVSSHPIAGSDKSGLGNAIKEK